MKRSCFKGCFCSKEVFVGQALPDNAPYKGHPAAFTLIELLVVVLIIGILAAIAVPQYQVAVAKSRTMSLLPLMKAIDDAEHVYLLANGEFTTDFNKLDITLPEGGTPEEETLESGAYMNKVLFNDFMCYLQDQNLPEDTYDRDDYISLICQPVRGEAPLLERYFNRKYYLCWANNNALAEKVCQSIAGTSIHSNTSGRRGKGYRF